MNLKKVTLEEFMAMDEDERYDATLDSLAEMAKPWQGDDPNSVIARTLIASMRPLLELCCQFQRLAEDESLQPMMGTLFVAHVQKMYPTLQTIISLGELKESK